MLSSSAGQRVLDRDLPRNCEEGSSRPNGRGWILAKKRRRRLGNVDPAAAVQKRTVEAGE
jgi:hypothetical protein